MELKEIKEIINDSINHVINDLIAVELSIEPDHVSISFSPWRPFKYNCPYEKGEDDGD